MFLELISPWLNCHITNKFISIHVQTKEYPALYRNIPWVASQSDLLGMDWIILD